MGRHLLAQESIGDLHEYAGPVAGTRIGADGPAVSQILEDTQTLANDPVTALALDMGDEADAAGVVLTVRFIEAKPTRAAEPPGPFGPCRSPVQPLCRLFATALIHNKPTPQMSLSDCRCEAPARRWKVSSDTIRR